MVSHSHVSVQPPWIECNQKAGSSAIHTKSASHDWLNGKHTKHQEWWELEQVPALPYRSSSWIWINGILIAEVWKNKSNMEEHNMHSHNPQKMLSWYDTWGLLFISLPGLQLHLETSLVWTTARLRRAAPLATMTIGDINIHDYFTAELQTQLRPGTSWEWPEEARRYVEVPASGALQHPVVKRMLEICCCEFPILGLMQLFLSCCDSWSHSCSWSHNMK